MRHSPRQHSRAHTWAARSLYACWWWLMTGRHRAVDVSAKFGDLITWRNPHPNPCRRIRLLTHDKSVHAAAALFGRCTQRSHVDCAPAAHALYNPCAVFQTRPAKAAHVAAPLSAGLTSPSDGIDPTGSKDVHVSSGEESRPIEGEEPAEEVDHLPSAIERCLSEKGQVLFRRRSEWYDSLQGSGRESLQLARGDLTQPVAPGSRCRDGRGTSRHGSRNLRAREDRMAKQRR